MVIYIFPVFLDLFCTVNDSIWIFVLFVSAALFVSNLKIHVVSLIGIEYVFFSHVMCVYKCCK